MFIKYTTQLSGSRHHSGVGRLTLRVLGFGLVAGLFSLGCSGGGVPPQGAASGVKAEGGCSDGREILEGFWGEEHREAFRERIMSLYRPSVEAEHARIAKALEQSTGRWLSAKEGVCEESKRGASSEVSLKKNRCLDDVMLQTWALVELVSASPAEYVRDAPGVIYDISSEIGACSHTVVWESYEADLSSGERQSLYERLTKNSVRKRLSDNGFEAAANELLAEAEQLQVPELELSALLNRSDILEEKGEFNLAQADLERALQIAQAHPPQRRYVTLSQIALASVARATGDNKRWLQLLEDALKTALRDYGENATIVASIYQAQGRYYHQNTDEGKARIAYEKAIEIFSRPQNQRTLSLARSYIRISEIYALDDRLEDAEAAVKRALKIFEELIGAEAEESGRALSALADIYVRQKDFARALPLYKKVLHIRQALYGAGDKRLAGIYHRLGLWYHHNMRYKEALENYEKSNELLSSAGETRNIRLAIGYTNIARVYFSLDRLRESERFYQMALSMAIEVAGERSGVVASILGQLAQVHHKYGEFDKAFELHVRGHELNLSLGLSEEAKYSLINIRTLCSYGYQPACEYRSE